MVVNPSIYRLETLCHSPGKTFLLNLQMSEQDLACLRSLHRRGLTTEQIHRLTQEQIRKSRFFPTTTIRTWLTDMDDLTNLAEHLEQASRIPSPARSVQIESRLATSPGAPAKRPSPPPTPSGEVREMIDQLMETNIELMKLAAVILGTVGSERNRSDPLTHMNTQPAAVVTAVAYRYRMTMTCYDYQSSTA